ncbi:HTH-type transcriptional regulator/antitoxin HigA [Parabacteroides sp. PFB2-12]|uniref:helix-turn-helix domain-containing protein n=1 Tax=unclassified Parabacteroides TaxID=2649774 RepID=UPI0024738E96|nr:MULTISPECIES: helix-turn-helix domain-containing protein [unclassified Parabacteroides]MDH6341371.1 HTH-type transcriptional regulator/antitoxin HigA [Parabacteroides sp. PM6-13]MDH6389165.1 HTH-type transcriptional regulator/antitoxin HigA [Parabacteroides sp. PFB2-12]
MTKIITEKQYQAACERIEELLPLVSNETPISDRNFIELDLISNLVADYEEKHFPVTKPTLIEILKLRMYEMNLTQKGLSELIGVSPSRISEILSGKSEPTFQMARTISKTLHIDADIVLGV